MPFTYAAASWADFAALARRIKSDEASWRRKFWRAIKRETANIPFLQDVLTAYYCVFDRHTPLYVKAVLAGAIAYFVIPDHLIPKNLPLIALADDAAIIAIAMKAVSSHIKPEHREAAQRTLARMRA
ncbi:MAG TPA: DUF1232 domain-containing protein [Xanthobacteraceae bacterium]|nr:DUF1232 domain-containing protein [Xanthobacteraceae bacterium]